MKTRHPANDGGIVSKAAVAVNLAEVGKHALDVVERLRTLGMPRQFRFLPCALQAPQVFSQNVNALLQFRELLSRLFVLPGVRFDQSHLPLDPIEFLLRLLSWVHETSLARSTQDR